jgi:predicted dienelactone hydrolase
MAMWVDKGMVAIALVGIVGFGALWLEHRSPVTLPNPTGTYAVGRMIEDWVDASGVDRLAPTPGQPRELLVWIWYPAAVARGTPPADYVPASVRPAARVGRLLLQPLSWGFALLTRDAGKVRGHSFAGPPVSSREPSFPVLLFRAGATAPVVNYSSLAEDLASHGYVVVGFDAPYRTMEVAFPDGRVIERRPENNPELFSGAELEYKAAGLLDAWTEDMAFVLDRLAAWNAADPAGRFTGRLDLARVGVFGHSFGGAAAAQFCSQDPRCTAGVDVDGSLHGRVIENGIHRPFLFLLSGNGDFSLAAEVRQIKADIQSVYDRLPPAGRLRAVIRGANHFTFSDDGALLKSAAARGALRLFGKLGISGRRQLEVTAYCLRSFFDLYVKGHGNAPLRLASALYPEIQTVP